MKICPFDKHVRKKFSEMFAAIGVIFSIVVAFFPIEQETRTVAGIVFASVCVVTYIGVWISAMLSKKVKLRIRNTNVVIQVGDIWEAPGKKVIPMNEFFDTENPGFIDENSLHGQFIRKYEGKGEDIYSHIISTLKSRGINGIVMKREQGKPIKFRLGTICEYDDIFMLAYTSFDKDNRANLYGDNFPKCYAESLQDASDALVSALLVRPIYASTAWVTASIPDAAVSPRGADIWKSVSMIAILGRIS